MRKIILDELLVRLCRDARSIREQTGEREKWENWREIFVIMADRRWDIRRFSKKMRENRENLREKKLLNMATANSFFYGPVHCANVSKLFCSKCWMTGGEFFHNFFHYFIENFRRDDFSLSLSLAIDAKKSFTTFEIFLVWRNSITFSTPVDRLQKCNLLLTENWFLDIKFWSSLGRERKKIHIFNLNLSWQINMKNQFRVN